MWGEDRAQERLDSEGLESKPLGAFDPLCLFSFWYPLVFSKPLFQSWSGFDCAWDTKQRIMGSHLDQYGNKRCHLLKVVSRGSGRQTVSRGSAVCPRDSFLVVPGTKSPGVMLGSLAGSQLLTTGHPEEQSGSWMA